MPSEDPDPRTARTRIRARSLGALALVLALCSPVHADAPQLAEAHIAIDEVRYDDAQRLLIAALEAGGNSPAAMRDIYKLLGASAVALGKTDDAEKYYRAWIALDVRAALDAGASPKLREPFDAAKSYITANGPLDVAAEYVSGTEVRIRVITDPLALARTARIGDSSVAIVDRGALVTNAPSRQVHVLDRYGNTLVEIQATGAPAPRESTPPRPQAELPGAPVSPPAPDAPPPTLGAGFYVLAVPTALLLAGGIGFGAASYVYNGKVQTALENSGAEYYTDVVDNQKKVTLFWKVAAIAGGAGLVLAIPTAILYKRSRDTVLLPFLSGDSAGAAISGHF